MANISFGTIGVTSQLQPGIGGAAVGVGPIYQSEGKWYAGQATAAKHACTAFCVVPCSAADKTLHYVSGGDLDPGVDMAVNDVLVVSATANAACPIGDLTTGDYLCIIGVVTAIRNVKLGFIASGAATP